MVPSDDRRPLAWACWFLRTERAEVSTIREAVGGLLVAIAVALLLLNVSGVWPPMIAVEGGSMEPHLSEGDLLFVVDDQRYASEHAVAGTGIVTYNAARRHDTRKNFGLPGDVIVFDANGPAGASTMHRAHLWVAEGENWYERADPAYLDGERCEAIPNCPAPHAGFITKGDASARYDQVTGLSEPVRPSWIHGRAAFRIPLLGHVRLAVEAVLAAG